MKVLGVLLVLYALCSSILCSGITSVSGNTNLQTTGGSTLTLNYVQDLNAIITCGQYTCAPSTVSPTQITCNIPAGTGGNLPCNLVVNGYLIGTFTASFAVPTISSISTVPTQGGLVTIVGSNLGSDAAAISATVNGQACTGVSIVTAQTTITCTAVAGTGANKAAVVTVSGQQSAVATFNYPGPVFTSASYVSSSGGVITITGQNFGTNPALITVTAEQYSCTCVTVITPNTVITCVLPANDQVPRHIAVAVDGQTSSDTNKAAFSVDLDIRADACYQKGIACDNSALFASNPVTAGNFTVYTLKATVDITGSVLVRAGVFLTATPFYSASAYTSSPAVTSGGNGAVYINATNITILQGAVVNVTGLGYGGGGGGGGGIYPDINICASGTIAAGGGTGATPNGEPQSVPWVRCGNAGGAGGGYGGASGTNGIFNVCGKSGAGGGAYGGGQTTTSTIGNCGARGANGVAGGYQGAHANGESTPGANDNVYLGSGGSGGAGGETDHGNCCGGIEGGSGGVYTNRGAGGGGCVGGGGGSGGAAGGGAIVLQGSYVQVYGTLVADGAGDAGLNGGYGAGGGILIKGTSSITIPSTAKITSLGGNALGRGVTSNGGSFKVRSPAQTLSLTGVSAGATSVTGN